MDNQHREIMGYRELRADEIALMNEIKTRGVALGELVNKLRSMAAADSLNIDARWISIGATHLQEGLMCLTRAGARPTFF